MYSFGLFMVELRCGAVAWGLWPTLRFHIPLIEPDMQISRIRLSDKTSRIRVQRLLQFAGIPTQTVICAVYPRWQERRQ